jgi:hypothetical protein
MNTLPALHDLLQYKNPLVIRRFKRNYPTLADKADTLFIDMLKYLWLSRKHEIDCENGINHAADFDCVMHREMSPIDEMWHTFILITKDYAAFCEQYFGMFMHHIPEQGENAEISITFDETEFEKKLQLFLSYVYDHLGEETVRSWFAMYTDNTNVDDAIRQ